MAQSAAALCQITMSVQIGPVDGVGGAHAAKPTPNVSVAKAANRPGHCLDLPGRRPGPSPASSSISRRVLDDGMTISVP